LLFIIKNHQITQKRNPWIQKRSKENRWLSWDTTWKETKKTMQTKTFRPSLTELMKEITKKKSIRVGKAATEYLINLIITCTLYSSKFWFDIWNYGLEGKWTICIWELYVFVLNARVENEWLYFAFIWFDIKLIWCFLWLCLILGDFIL